MTTLTALEFAAWTLLAFVGIPAVITLIARDMGGHK